MMAVLLLFCTFLSIACGVKSVGIQSVLGAFVPNGAPELEVHIVLARVPRTVFGVLAGAALGAMKDSRFPAHAIHHQKSDC